MQMPMKKLILLHELPQFFENTLSLSKQILDAIFFVYRLHAGTIQSLWNDSTLYYEYMTKVFTFLDLELLEILTNDDYIPFNKRAMFYEHIHNVMQAENNPDEKRVLWALLNYYAYIIGQDPKGCMYIHIFLGDNKQEADHK